MPQKISTPPNVDYLFLNYHLIYDLISISIILFYFYYFEFILFFIAKSNMRSRCSFFFKKLLYTLKLKSRI
jgi:hypothetical protein